MEMFDVLILGAGPSGLACAIECQRGGLRAAALDKGCLCNSIYNYPANMTFFTTPELLEIGGIPFSCAQTKPTRMEALEYYRRVAEHFRLDVRQYHAVSSCEGADGNFVVHAMDRLGRAVDFATRKLVIASGYYDLPNELGVPGENLDKVTHYYREPHPYYDSDVLVVGAKNSAAIAALELWRHGARVTLVHRGTEVASSVKYWIKPDLENRIRNQEIAAYFKSSVKEIAPDSVQISTPAGEKRIKNDFVLAMTGYHPDFTFLRALGIELAPGTAKPKVNLRTLESNVPGIYLAGVVLAGFNTNEIFIENGRFHGRQIAHDVAEKLGTAIAEVPEVAIPTANLRNAE
ncbi:MAG: YpdA family putative bacillithiol disulfide reductase [Acidobacteriota bacterium]|nr:YpdA family putative bacillithiol disulfide reductase [Acidobacteriota bacterium]